MKNILQVFSLAIVLFIAASCVPTEFTKFSIVSPTTYEDGSNLPESEIDGFKFYCGTASGVYTTIKDVGKNNEYVISDIIFDASRRQYCVVTCYTAERIESAYSNEKTIP